MAYAPVPKPVGGDAEVPLAGHALVFIAAFGIALSRRPDALLHAQFFAEGGKIFFAEAYNHGMASLLMSTPGAGYLQIPERLIALLACLVPLAAAPLLTNLISLIIMVLPVALLLSSRFSFVGSLRFRGALAFAYLALPSSGEVFANVASIKGYMPLLACLVVFAGPDDRMGWKIFDLAVLVVFSLTGPTTVLFLPLLLALWWLRRQKWLLVEIMAVLPGTALQAAVMLTTMHKMRTGTTAPLGATPKLLMEILARQMFLAPLLGVRAMPPKETAGYLAFCTVVTVLGLAALAYAAWKAAWPIKLFLYLAVSLAAASLLVPLCSRTIPQWQVMVRPGACNRYWLVPMLGFLAALVWMARTQQGWRKLVPLLVLSVMLVGIIRDWRHPGYRIQNFPQQAAKFAAMPPGARMTFAIEPPGWTMELVRK